MAPEVLEPGDAASLAAKLKWANAEGLAIAVRGAGTKQAWGAPASRADVVLSTLGLNTPIDHVAGDLVATVPAGATLDAVNDVLRREKQWLPLDPGVSHLATIGGVIATNDSGPRRHRYGTPRDLILGVEIALVGGKMLQGYLHAGMQQRLSDVVAASGRFVGLTKATLLPDGRALGDIALHSGAIAFARDLRTGTAGEHELVTEGES